MQEFIRFISQGWVGTLVGTAGLTLALLLYWRSRISGIIAWQSRDVPMIGDSDAVFPAEVEVRYRGTPVPRLMSSTVCVWNAGKKTVIGADIVAHDPLQFRFSGEVLKVRIRKVSREAVLITADIPGETEKTIRFGFEFLDPGDGGVLEVLHTGSAKAPECTGTIIGLPKGSRYWGHAWGSSASSRLDRRFTRLICAVMFIMGLGMSVEGIFGERAIEEILPFLAEPPEMPEPPSWLRRGFLILFGPLILLFSAVLWVLRRRSPASLDIDRTESEKAASRATQ